MPKLTYPLYSDPCGWNAMLPPRTPRPALSGDLTVETLVIGAGYTGLGTAHRLAELSPDAEIAVLEASILGEGSSGRNSGFTSADVLPRSATLAGAEKARRQSALFAEAFDWLTALIQDHGIDCQWQKVGSIRGAATLEGEASLRQVLEVAKANNLPHLLLDQKAIAERIGSSYYRFGLFLPDTYLLQPAALIRGIAAALPNSVRLYEETPVIRLRRLASGWEAKTPGGLVRAKNVVLATNAFIPKLGYLRSRMATIFTYAAVTEAIAPKDQPHLGQSSDWGLLPSHRLGTTLRRIGADRLMVRSLYAHEHEMRPEEVRQLLRQRFERRWPGLKHVAFDYVWGGTTAFTMNGAPWWGKLDEGLYASGGCNGSGITKGSMLGRRLADLIRGQGNPGEVPAIMGTPDWIAPEPFRSVGFKVISRIESRKAGLEA